MLILSRLVEINFITGDACVTSGMSGWLDWDALKPGFFRGISVFIGISGTEDSEFRGSLLKNKSIKISLLSTGSGGKVGRGEREAHETVLRLSWRAGPADYPMKTL